MSVIKVDYGAISGGRTDIEVLFCRSVNSDQYYKFGLYNFADGTGEQCRVSYSGTSTNTLKNKVQITKNGSHDFTITAINGHYLYMFSDDATTGSYLIDKGINGSYNKSTFYSSTPQFIITDSPLDMTIA